MAVIAIGFKVALKYSMYFYKISTEGYVWEKADIMYFYSVAI